MHRSDQDGTVIAFPTPGAVGSPLGYFTEAQPCRLGADWLNAVQEELIACLTAAAISPSKVDRTQFLASLKFLRRRSLTRVVTINDTSVATDNVLFIDDTAGNITQNLITAVGRAGYRLVLRKTKDTANVITIDGNGTETVGGALTQTLNDLDDQLIIESDGANWKIKDRNFRQFVVGTAQTSLGSAAFSTSYAAPSNNPTVSITPRRTGLFRVYGTFPIEPDTASGAGNGCAIKVVATVGSPTVIQAQEATIHPWSASFGSFGSTTPYTIFKLTAGTAYTFTIHLKNTIDNGVHPASILRNDLLSAGTFLTVQEIK